MSQYSTQDVPDIGSQDSEGEVTLAESRIRDGWHAHAIYRKLEWEDSASEEARANIDYQIDGGKPYSDQVMRDANRGDETNVNFREARAEDDLAQTPFIEMGTVSQDLWSVRTSFGNEHDRTEWSKIISQEFTKTVRAWGGDFDYYLQRLAQQFTRHGVGFAYFEDEVNWQWRSDGLSPFKLPRDTESRSSAIPYCVCKRTMSVDELYKFIRNEERAKDQGYWNIEAVKRALVFSTTNSQTWYNYSWEQFMREAKENDIEFGNRAEKIRVFHLWCKEFDGRMSHYIGLQDGVAMEQGGIKNPEDLHESDMEHVVGHGQPYSGFLYAHRNRFPAFESCIIPFFYAIGTHATIHTIRGMGEMNFGPISVSNRAMCTLLDCAKTSSMIVMGAESANDAEKFSYVQYGGFLIYTGGLAKMEPNAMPDVSGRMQPVLDRMAALRAQVNPSGAAQPKDSKGKQPQTKYQIQATQNKGGALNSAMLTQWFGPFGRLGREMFRRMVNPKLSGDDPGGKEAFKFRARCMAQGVPAEALHFDLCEVEAVRVIGNGSPEQRQYAAEQIWEMKDSLDEAGAYQAKLDLLASIPGVTYQAALNYCGPYNPRQPIDKQIADLENVAFQLGKRTPVEGEQNHWVHCQTHSELVKQLLDGFKEGQVQGAELVPQLSAALDNMLEHSKILSKDKTREKEAAWVRQFIQTSNGTLEQQENKLVAEQQRQAEAQGQQPQGGEPSDMAKQMEAQQKNDLHQAKIAQMQQEQQMRQQRFQQELALQDMESKQRLRLADMKVAHDIAMKTATLAAS